MMTREWSNEEIQSGSMKWSLMTDTDRTTIRNVVEEMCDSLPPKFPLNFLEIGTYNGSTAWGVKTVTERKGRWITYWGIDMMSHDAVLWPTAKMMIGDSTKIF